MNPVQRLTSLGQSLWFDNIQRKIVGFDVTPRISPRFSRLHGLAGMLKRFSGSLPLKIYRLAVIYFVRYMMKPKAAMDL